ncbi:tRNA-specific adenosine deaminase 1 isoform X2 [Anoplophora glabripennis]|uniref:tRNA-specific adenosine deaminase 1 isoform X2 n=1 Tax=Anoplophora glabripennis TaxID=217634 RepID=UPI0008741F06|nr:tRNA-specific adenosine deaminase 1 isoform X2 [Anoplophora glabripennis]
MEVDQEFHDKVAALCLKRFETLPKSGKPKMNEWTVLSGVVLEFEGNLSVVALGTGSKCIGKTKLSPRGDILNDSHAEIICRRSLLRFLLDRMKNGAAFLHFSNSSKKYSVSEGVRFHFFTTHVPCGDASIFLKEDVEDFGEILGSCIKDVSDEYEVPRKIAKVGEESDIFRTGAKCLEQDERQDLKGAGCGYHVLGAIRTKPGRGDPTLSISCSDKLSRWCHLGVQGALLSLLLERPIYFSTFTIAAKMPFSKDTLERALYDRVGSVKLKHPYTQQKLIVGQAVLPFDLAKDAAKRPSDCSISWCDVKERRLFGNRCRRQTAGSYKKEPQRPFR